MKSSKAKVSRHQSRELWAIDDPAGRMTPDARFLFANTATAAMFVALAFWGCGCTYVWVNAPDAIIAPAVEVSP